MIENISNYVDVNGMAFIAEKRIKHGAEVRQGWHQCRVLSVKRRYWRISFSREIKNMTRDAEVRMESKGLPYKIEYRVSIGIPNETFACSQCKKFRSHNNNSYVCMECFLENNPDLNESHYNEYRLKVDPSIVRIK